jgi:hypothetical protein
MCGNFGLLFLKNQTADSENAEPEPQDGDRKKDVSRNGFMQVEREEHNVKTRTVSFGKHDGLPEDNEDTETGESAITSSKDALRSPLLILEAQAANTEIRGGQAGGYSSLEYQRVKNTSPAAMHPVGETVHSPFRSTHSVGSSTHSKIVSNIAANPKHGGRARQNSNPEQRHAAQTATNTNSSAAAGGDIHSPLHASNHDATVHSSYQRNRTMSQSGNFAQFEAEYVSVPHNTRVRTVARKRYPLAADLSSQFLQTRKGKTIELDNTFTGTDCSVETAARPFTQCLMYSDEKR